MNRVGHLPRSVFSRERTSSLAILFLGRYKFRTINGLLAAVIPLVFTVAFATVAVKIFGFADELLTRIVGSGFVVGALIFGSLGLYALFSLISNKSVEISISEEGITAAGRFKAWEEIGKFYGNRYSNGICLCYAPKSTRIHFEKSIATTPLLSEQEYMSLAQEMCRCVGHRYPDLEIAMQPMESAGGS